MKMYFVGILVSFIFVFSLAEIKGETLQISQYEVSVMEIHANDVGEECYSSIDAGYAAMSLSDCFIIEAFRLKICDARVSGSLFVRGVNFPKNLKFVSSIQLLSSRNTSLFVRDSRSLYFHYCFVKSSYRYFVYTLERLLI